MISYFFFSISDRKTVRFLDRKSLQKFQWWCLHGSIFGLYSNDLPGNVICNIYIYKYIFLQLVLAFEFESGLQDTVDWCRKWLLDGNAGKN